MTTSKKITVSQARQILAVVDAGLRAGAGSKMVAGELCVEQAVAMVIDGRLSDNPSCVHATVRSFKIRLNDSGWSSNEARAKGMRELAIAQLGTNDPSFDPKLFVIVLARETTRQMIPFVFRMMLKHAKLAEWHAAIEAVCLTCESAPSHAAAIAARALARKIRHKAWSAAAADAAADAAAAAAADAAAGDAAARSRSRLEAYKRMAEKLLALMSEAPVHGYFMRAA